MIGLEDAPIVGHRLLQMLTQFLQEILIVGNNDELEVGLLSALVDDTR